jgi:hypothetical protein
MNLKSRISATVVGLTLLAGQVVAPALAQEKITPSSTPEQVTPDSTPEQVTPDSTPGQVTPDSNADSTSTISEEQAAQSELSASEAEIEKLVNEDIIEEVPPSQVEVQSAPRNFRERALKAALEEIGYKEQPLGSNCNKFSRYFGKKCQRWCANFVSWAFDSTGNRNKKVDWGNPSAVQAIRDWAKKGNHFVTTPQPGDIFLIIGNGVSHTGLVRSVSGKTFTTVEGNASNKVRSVKRSLSSRYLFVRVDRPQ